MLRKFAILLGLFQLQAILPADSGGKNGPVTHTALKRALRFEPNVGQSEAATQFVARGSDYTMLLTGTQMVMLLDDRANPKSQDFKSRTAVKMSLVSGSNSGAVEQKSILPSVTNYYLGREARNWHTAVPNYGKVSFNEVYPGIDVVYYGQEGKLEYDFVVRPGADPGRIRLKFSGADSLRVNPSGDLVVKAGDREIIQRKPFIYQQIGGTRRQVSGEYRVIKGTQEVHLALAMYDRSLTLVIDPVVVWATYLGGTTNDYGQGVSVDSSGAAYVVGKTSGSFPLLNPTQGSAGGGIDVFVTKYSSGGTLVYSTYIGGAGDDTETSIAVQPTGEAYITGTTAGSFPLLNAAQGSIGGLQDAFVAKLTATGALSYSTYLGGPGNDAGKGIAVDSTGTAYVIGDTAGPSFPASGPGQGTFGGGASDAFVTKYNPAGTIAYSTFLGGNLADIGGGIAVDSAGTVYVAGTTAGAFPILNGAQTSLGGQRDAFLAKLSSTGTLSYSTYLGGINDDAGLDVGIDSAGSVFVTGFAGPAFPTVNAAQPTFGGGAYDAFVTKFGTAGQIIFSTYFGGPGTELTRGIAIDGGGSVYIGGSTFSTLPIVNAVQPTYGGGTGDAFVAKFNGAGVIRYATYLGGSGEDTGTDIAVDNTGAAYLSGYVLFGPFPVKNAAQPAFGGAAWDAFVVKISAEPTVRIGTYTGGQWKLDANGNGTFEPSLDRSFALGFSGATVVTGDWNGDGKTKTGVYSNGYWFLDYDGNGVWDNGVVDKVVGWGWAGVTPIVGDWNGDGKDKIGVYSNGFWFLDYNGDYLWDGGTIDKQIGWGWAGVTPIVGDWNGNGKAKIGVYNNGFWFLDYNGDYLWDNGVVDKQVGWGWAGVTTVVGDWNGDGKTKIGVYSGGYWYLDYDGNYLWDYPAKDQVWQMGWPGTTPVMGDWSGDGRTKAGAFINGYWYLDYNGSGLFDGHGVDRIFQFGTTGDVPQVGVW